MTEPDSTDERLTWVTINLESGGLDYIPATPLLRRLGGVHLDRLDQLGELATFAGFAPDVIFFQEGRTFDVNGAELMFYSERVLHRHTGIPYRAFLARSDYNDLHQVIYINPHRVQPIHHWRGEDPNEGTRRYGWLNVIVGGDETTPIMLKSDHWDPRDGDARLRFAKFSAGHIRGHRAIRAGDLNSTTSRRSNGHGEPQRDFLAQTPFHRYGKGYWPPQARWWWGPLRRRAGDTIADTRAIDYLIDVGWRDQHIADNNTSPTIYPGHDRGGELIIDRCLIHGALATVPGSVVVDTAHPGLSNHCAVAGAVYILKDAPTPKPARFLRRLWLVLSGRSSRVPDTGAY